MTQNPSDQLFRKLAFQPVAQPALEWREPKPGLGRRLHFADPKETVEAQRRRRGSGSGPSGRADMPGRPSSSGQGGSGMPPANSGGSPSGNSGGQRSLPMGVIILLLAAYFLYTIFFSNDSSPASTIETQDTPQNFGLTATNSPAEVIIVKNTPTAEPGIAPTRNSSNLPTNSGAKNPAKTWTVMLYEDADDPVLEEDMTMDLNEAERVGSNQQVNIVAQIDRYAGAYKGDGDWTSTRRYYLTKDNDLFHLHSKMVADLGEASMADPKTLVDFVTWAIQTYPADKYVLILSDHGMGWPGGFTDPKPSALRSVNTVFAQAMNQNMMYTNDIDQALGQIRQQTGIDHFELIGMDACLMSHLEVYSALAPHARFVVSSQETEPALGWAYSGFLQALEDNPAMDGAELGRQIVSSYIVKDERIVDSQARIDYLRQGSPLGGLFSSPADMDPTRLSKQIKKSVTLTAAGMDALPGLMNGVNELAFALQKEDQAVVARVRTYAQSYTSVFGDNVPPSYIDLGNFAQLLQQESTSAAIRNAAGKVAAQVKQVVVAEMHGSEKPGSTGISIYFPNSKLYKDDMAGARSYAQIANRFGKDSLWDDFLAFHYTHASFKIDTGTPVVPGGNSRVVAPGAGQIEISPLKLSLSVVDSTQPVTFEADLSGSNIGYVYLFVGYYDPGSKSILVADKDYLESPKTRQVGNLYYPNWSDSQSFKLKYTWTPSVFAIDDGAQSVVALLNPERYGASAEEAVYTADGTFADSATGRSFYARMYFSNGQLKQVFGFTGMDPTGPLSEITPQTGDQITLVQTWLESDGSGGYRQVTENGQTLVFGQQPFTWKELYAAAGDYRVGFVVSDLDGNEKQALGAIKIK